VTFEELNIKKSFQQALADLEYINPTPIQAKTFPVIMSGKNAIGIAQTGTGKTFAYLLPILNSLTFSTQREARVLILAPTRVLVVQIVEEIKKLTKYCDIRSAGVYGDTNINTQKQLVYDGLDILVATPGRLIDLVFTGVLRLKSVKKLVIDEVDEMLSLGLRPQLASVLGLLPEKRQNLMFSATITPDVEEFITNTLIDPQRILVHPHGTPIEKINQFGYHVPNFNSKANLLKLLLNENDDLSKVLVFVKSKKGADHLFEKIGESFPNQISVIHSNKAHNTRLTALKHFEEGTHRILIATDIVARGMDISDVSHVINFDMPEAPGDYLHRIGRTGRANKDGEAISFIAEWEQEFQFSIEQMMGKHIVILPLPSNLEVSKVLTEEEKPVNLGDKDYLSKVNRKGPKPLAHSQQKKEKNKKVNLGGPKNRKEKFEKLQKAKNPNKPKKTRF
jgi:ATP-dependent RNA helicase RhlE